MYHLLLKYHLLTSNDFCDIVCYMESNLKIKAVAYARVSTLLGQTVENQTVPIRQFCEARGFELVHEYCDEGQSGAKARRPQLDQLLKDAKTGKFKILVVAGLDRLGRNVKHLLTLLDELNALGVKFISLRESIDLSTPQGVMTMQVLAAVAELERELIRQRIREAMAARKVMAHITGWRCGRPTVVTDEVIQKVLDLRKQGRSIREIENAMGKVVSRGTIERILRSAAGSRPRRLR